MQNPPFPQSSNPTSTTPLLSLLDSRESKPNPTSSHTYSTQPCPIQSNSNLLKTYLGYLPLTLNKYKTPVLALTAVGAQRYATSVPSLLIITLNLWTLFPLATRHVLDEGEYRRY